MTADTPTSTRSTRTGPQWSTGLKTAAAAVVAAVGLVAVTAAAASTVTEAKTRETVAAEQGQAVEDAIATNAAANRLRHDVFTHLEREAGGPLYEACFDRSGRVQWACDIVDVLPDRTGGTVRVKVQRSYTGSPELDQMQADALLTVFNSPGSPLERVSVVAIEQPAVEAHA